MLERPLKTKIKAAIAFSLFATTSAGAMVDRVSISNFNQNLKGWEQKSFAGKTQYKIAIENGKKVLIADSMATASGLGKKIKVDLKKTPYINWSWKVDNTLKGLDETTKAGDDYVARLYVVKSGGPLLWKTKALNYVWSSNQSQEKIWRNAFQPKNAIMLAVRGNTDQPGQWVTEKRNVLEDFKRAFGKDIDNIDAVAIMTDTDNSMREASASYGEIYFTAQ